MRPLGYNPVEVKVPGACWVRLHANPAYSAILWPESRRGRRRHSPVREEFYSSCVGLAGELETTADSQAFLRRVFGGKSPSSFLPRELPV